MRKLLIITLFLLFFQNASAAIVNSENADFKIRETDDYSLVLENEEGDTLIKQYSSMDSIEAISYDKFIIYNGDQGGIGLYIYDISSNKSFLLNSAGNYASAIFYNKFNVVNDKLFIYAGIETASMPKICAYDLTKLSEVLEEERDQLESYLKSEDDTELPHLYKFTEENTIANCTFDDGKFYYDVEVNEDERIKYTTCEDSICEEEEFKGAEVYESDWDGENKELIKVIGENQTKKWLGIGIPALVVFGSVTTVVLRRKKK